MSYPVVPDDDGYGNTGPQTVRPGFRGGRLLWFTVLSGVLAIGLDFGLGVKYPGPLQFAGVLVTSMAWGLVIFILPYRYRILGWAVGMLLLAVAMTGVDFLLGVQYPFPGEQIIHRITYGIFGVLMSGLLWKWRRSRH